MSPDDYETNQSAVWGTLVVILLVIIAILLVGYFAWWAPAHRKTIIIERSAAVMPASQHGSGDICGIQCLRQHEGRSFRGGDAG